MSSVSGAPGTEVVLLGRSRPVRRSRLDQDRTYGSAYELEQLAQQTRSTLMLNSLCEPMYENEGTYKRRIDVETVEIEAHRGLNGSKQLFSETLSHSLCS
jgi:hypothetical protein